MGKRRTAVIAIKASLFTGLVLVTLAASCHPDGPEQVAEAFAWSGELAAPATLNIRNTNGAITVEPSADNAVRVTAEVRWRKGDWKRDVTFQAVPVGSDVTVCAMWDRGTCSAAGYASGKKRRGMRFSWNRSDASIAFKVQVPAGVKVDGRTYNGPITVRAAAPVKAHTLNGDVIVGTSVGPVDAETLNGDVDIRMTTLGVEMGPVRAVTKNGTATAYVPEILDGRIKASTLTGELGTDFGGPAAGTRGPGREFVTTFGLGDREYLVQTLNGSAWLRLINADGTVGRGVTAATATAEPAAERRARPSGGSRNPR